jgi:hypothetical protein
MWINLRGFGAALDEVAMRRMTVGAIATTASAVVLLGIAVAHYSFGRRGSRVGAALFVIAAFASLALPLAARGPAVSPAAPRPLRRRPSIGQMISAAAVTVLMLDGARSTMSGRACEGRLQLRAPAGSGAAMDWRRFARRNRIPLRGGGHGYLSSRRSLCGGLLRATTTGRSICRRRSLSHALCNLSVRDAEASAAWRAADLEHPRRKASASVSSAGAHHPPNRSTAPRAVI